MAGSEQTPALTYWYLKEALKTQKPSLVVMEGTSLFFRKYENYTQTNVVYMPWGANRIGAIIEASEPEKRLGLVFDLYFYHDRWKTITKHDILKAFTPRKIDNFKGHTAVDQVFSDLGDGPYKREITCTEEEYKNNLMWLNKIYRLCESQEIPLMVTTNPTYSHFEEDVYIKLKEDIINISPNIIFELWYNNFESFGLDVTKHLNDIAHLNHDGAEIFSAVTAEYIKNLGVVPRIQTEENKNRWIMAAESYK